jgi:hypothetical protein
MSTSPTTFYVMHGDTAMFHVPTYEAAVAKIDAQPAHMKPDMAIWNSRGERYGCKFEVGKTYWTTSICDSECVYTITVIRRTAKTLYVTEHGEAKTLRIKIGFRDHEQVKPHGSYSMAATISADKVQS